MGKDFVGVKVRGLKPLRRKFAETDPAVVAELTALARKGAEAVASAAIAKAPRVSGTLAGTIRAGATKTKAYVRVGSAAVPYAPPIHWGWPSHNIEAQPFLYEALDEHRDEIVAEYAEGLHEVIERVFNAPGGEG